MTSPTLCRDCDLVHSDTRKLSPWKWRCVKWPVPNEAPEELAFVDPAWRTEPPYALCRDRNDGACFFYTPLRQKEIAQ